jgi:membrane-bound serine protease (ClpP class)
VLGRERRRRGRAGHWRLAGFGVLALRMLSGGLFTQSTRPVVYVVPIAGMIDLGLAPFVQRVLDEAVGANAAAVILEINTFGGRVDAAVLIRDALLQARMRTVAFVNKRAISAGLS